MTPSSVGTKGEARRRRTRSGVSASDPVPGGSGWLAVFSLAIGRPLVASSNRVPAAALSVTCCTRCALFASAGRPWLTFLLQGVVFSIGCATVVNEKHNTLNGGKKTYGKQTNLLTPIEQDRSGNLEERVRRSRLAQYHLSANLPRRTGRHSEHARLSHERSSRSRISRGQSVRLPGIHGRIVSFLGR